eukprot:TRINITY_DN25202_c0_g1_i1.p1 TRINITY_DN25202_c0_g1~~TRINITY_DN25202_c0_g1_i1.p1  ORF type:complete len:1193 (-),score=124.46 TRINITY_DN25202_c0_g1_i1:48-3605(-)
MVILFSGRSHQACWESEIPRPRLSCDGTLQNDCTQVRSAGRNWTCSSRHVQRRRYLLVLLVEALCLGFLNALPDSSLPDSLLESLRNPTAEENLVASGSRSATSLFSGPTAKGAQAPQPLIRPGGAQMPAALAAPDRNDGIVPSRMLLPLPRDYFVKLAGPEKLAIVSWTTGAPRKGEKGTRAWIAINLALSIRKYAQQLEKRFAFISMDSDAHRVMGEFGFNSVPCMAGTCRSKDLKDDIWKMRWYLMLTITGFGLSVLVVDADIVFLRDPTKELWMDSDLEVMTDHFFPERHLFEPWVRVEDHINTGFVLARPNAPIRTLLVEFLNLNWESEQGGVQRDGMDQRVFNHFIVRKMAADVPVVFARYCDLTYGRRQQIVPPAPFRQASIRILDPTQIAHGMNFFWRRAHLLDAETSDVPAVAHINGADPKEYFLRDRRVWFVDDWQERFGDDPKFLVYQHTQGLNLKDDFTLLQAAIEIARLTGRRLVLPATMNCRNTPAYHVWGLDVTVQRSTDRGNCTFDYFSWAKHLLDAQESFVVESSIVHHEIFQQLEEESKIYLPTSIANAGDGDGDPSLEEILSHSAAVLDLGPLSALDVRDALRDRFGKREWNNFKCIFQQFPHQVNVCRDDRYVGRFGDDAKCDPYPSQAACGVEGFTCCMAFWGYSEKLEIFTGARWDLPCNCGLGSECALTKQGLIDREQQQYERHCCAHIGQPSPQEHCILVPPQRNMTIYGDSHFYSSYLMQDFLDGRIDPAAAFKRCKEHRAGTLLDTDLSRAKLHCNHMLSGIALWRGRYDRLFRLLEYMHIQRRRIGQSTPLSTETGEQEDETLAPGFPLAWKVLHDREQLAHIAKRPLRHQVSPYAPMAPPQFSEQLLNAYDVLISSLRQEASDGVASPAQLLADGGQLAALRPYLGRAVHVPHVEKHDSSTLSTSAAWGSLTKSFLRKGVGKVDDALTERAVSDLHGYFMEATVWYTPRAGGSYLKAQLRDGLHAELLLQLAAELPQMLPDVLGPHRLIDIYAHKYDTEWTGFPGMGVHVLPCAVAVGLWTAASSANLASKGNGFEIYEAEASANMTAAQKYVWAPRLDDDVPKRDLIAATGFRSTVVPYRRNRLVIWRADKFFRADLNPRRWRGGFKNRRVDLWLLYGSPSELEGTPSQETGRLLQPPGTSGLAGTLHGGWRAYLS